MNEEIRGFKDERRLFQRIKVNLPARITDLVSDKLIKVKACDVSAQGVGISTQERLDRNVTVKVSLSIPARKRNPLVTYGKVAWIKPESRWGFRAGISFDRPEFIRLSPLLRF